MPRNASFKNDLLRRHSAGDRAGERFRAEQLEVLPRKRWPHMAPMLVKKEAARHERCNAQEAGHFNEASRKP